ncbi:alpha/beta fold hydrolase [Phosphitispora fastidiosa]|uniref:alpha/beta fold hydrolase n=1 Tax=Phosphitispora fastidiosa TaxID=2837202 RepID=UPI003390537F
MCEVSSGFAAISNLTAGFTGSADTSPSSAFRGNTAARRATQAVRRVAGIRTPTLVVHAEDDTLQPYQNAVFTSSTIPGARLLSFENGGHFAVAIEQSTISREVYKHISNAEFETEE